MLGGCGGPKPPTSTQAPAGPAVAATPRSAPKGSAAETAGPIDAASTQAALAKLPHGLTLGEECPIEVPHAASEEQSARVPLTVGLTLSSVWSVEGQDFECLKQVTAVTDFYVDVTGNCPARKNGNDYTYKRRLCQSDLREAYFYLTQTYPQTLVPSVVSATMFSLSSRALHELKAKGITRHRYIEFADRWRTRSEPMNADYDESLVTRKDGRPTMSVIINDAPVELPVITAVANEGLNLETTAAIVDDDRFPLVLEYKIRENSFSIHYTKISYPNQKNLEQRLTVDKRIDVYGIYFDSASDRLRPQSEPVVADIAAVLAKNPSWKLDINGHTDNIGGDDANLKLSGMRAQSVKSALVQQYKIAPDRLNTAGFGASRPQASNETPEGRARNRRVELVRR